ncbi:MAG: cytochrome c [Gammaproteobacteria bacterium]
MKIFAAIAIFIALMMGTALLVIYSGLYNVAATQPDNPLVRWALSTTSDHSISYHAKQIKAPLLTDAALIKEGLYHYREMCVPCHGRPGLYPTELNKGLNPRAPKLAESAKEFNASELFWVIKNGIKMTGMPAWGTSHSDDKIWAIVAFVKRLPALTPQEYVALDQAVQKEAQERNHVHQH